MATAMAKVRGLGSAKEGIGHWKLQRITAIGNAVLALWLLINLLSLGYAGYEDYVAWLSSPINAALMCLLSISLFWHAKLGLQVVVEDYIHQEGLRIGLLLLLTLFAWAGSAICVVSVIRILVMG